MECCDIAISAETLISEKYLRYGAHPGFLRELDDDIGSRGDIDRLISRTERIEEIFGFHAVWTVVFGVEGEHKGDELLK